MSNTFAENDPVAKPAEEARSAGSVQVHLRLTEVDYARLRWLARRRDQTLSATVRFLLALHLRELQHLNPPGFRSPEA
jgi:hypothetical protein